MLQLIDTTCPPASQPALAPTAARGRTFWLSVAMTALLSVGLGSAALAQAPSSTSDSQTTPSGQTSKPVVAAPGTVAVSAATAAALAPYTGPTYDNRWEIYGGLLFMNGQAGQNLPVRYNMGGAEAMATYWLGNGHSGPLSKLGVAVDVRFGAGTTPVISPFYNRVVAMQAIGSGGVQYRGPKNRYVAIDFHALAGGDWGIFNYAPDHYPGGSPEYYCAANKVGSQGGTLGLYCNHVAPWGTAGGSIDFNESAKLAIRLQPDIIFEHFGTETREFFGISLGAVYRIGKVK
jgi:hypothetical protein